MNRDEVGRTAMYVAIGMAVAAMQATGDQDDPVLAALSRAFMDTLREASPDLPAALISSIRVCEGLIRALREEV